MTIYQRLLLGMISGRVSTLIIIALGLILMPKDQNPFAMGFVCVLLIIVGGAQIYHIINYLSMSKLELIQQIRWERNK